MIDNIIGCIVVLKEQIRSVSYISAKCMDVLLTKLHVIDVYWLIFAGKREFSIPILI